MISMLPVPDRSTQSRVSGRMCGSAWFRKREWEVWVRILPGIGDGDVVYDVSLDHHGAIFQSLQ